jgi:16S rRNA (guanine(966)-N(2))-methyltransferase RsmD
MTGHAQEQAQGRVRISAGSLRGRVVSCPESGGVRPMLNRTRMALFNLLTGAVKGAVVWDCFAGSGLLGIEALSRGASHCVFVEREAEHARVVRENLAGLGLQAVTTLIRGSVFELVKSHAPPLPHTPADLLLLDPPHAMARDMGGPFWQWLSSLGDTRLVKPGTRACFGHPAELAAPDAIGPFLRADTRVYGSVAFTIWQA